MIEMEEYRKWTSFARQSWEGAMNFPPTAATGREALCVAVELSQTSFMQLKTPETHRTSNQSVSESHTAQSGLVQPAALTLCVGEYSTYILL